MAERETTPIGEIKNVVAALVSDAREMAILRWRLARMELESDAKALLKTLIIWAVAAIMILSALPLAVVCAAELLEGFLGIARWGWLLILCCGMLTASAAAIYLAWRRLRGRALLLKDSLAECREDLAWFEEWTTRIK
jgi:uncharacterized membrane protein YbhN (UPF0104 family)